LTRNLADPAPKAQIAARGLASQESKPSFLLPLGRIARFQPEISFDSTGIESAQHRSARQAKIG
jgi:hypothetical protein